METSYNTLICKFTTEQGVHPPRQGVRAAGGLPEPAAESVPQLHPPQHHPDARRHHQELPQPVYPLPQCQSDRTKVLVPRRLIDVSV